MIIWLIVAGWIAWQIRPREISYLLAGDITYLDSESTTTTAVFSIVLENPENADFDDVTLHVLDDEGDFIEDFPCNFSDENLDGYLNTGDKISLTLDEGEWESESMVVMTINDYDGSATYEFY